MNSAPAWLAFGWVGYGDRAEWLGTQKQLSFSKVSATECTDHCERGPSVFCWPALGEGGNRIICSFDRYLMSHTCSLSKNQKDPVNHVLFTSSGGSENSYKNGRRWMPWYLRHTSKHLRLVADKGYKVSETQWASPCFWSDGRGPSSVFYTSNVCSWKKEF